MKAKEVSKLNGWYNTYYTPLVLWADTIVKDISVAEDIVQELFTRLWEQDRYKILKEETIKSYLYISVRNSALRSIKSHRKIQNLPDMSIVEKVWEEADCTRDDLLKKIREEIEKLPPRSREVLECVHLKGMKYAEVACHLGISVTTVKTLLVRSLKNLRVSLDGELYLLFLFLRKVEGDGGAITLRVDSVKKS